MILAAFTFPSARRIPPITDAPIPNISPIPVHIKNIGATILMAARALLPTPWPTNMPSHMFNTELKNMPTKVGKNMAMKSGLIPAFLKSSLSLSIQTIF